MKRYTLAGAGRRLGRVAFRIADRFGAVERPAGPEDFPAGIRRWLDRRDGRLKANLPREWRQALSPARGNPAPRVAVVIHVFYVDLLDDILRRLAFIPVPFDVLITNSSGQRLDIDVSSLPGVNSVVVLEVENRGRDILPMIRLVNAGLLEPYELILKVHTKMSPWRQSHPTLGGTGSEWREEFLDQLAGSKDGIRRILAAFADDPSLGLLTADGSVRGSDFWGSNAEIARDLMTRLQLPLTESELRFPSGSMYWVRSFVLQGLRALDLTDVDFEPEAGQIDMTTAHAVERIVGVLAVEAGLKVAELQALPPVGSTVESGGTMSRWRRYRPDGDVVPRARVIPFYLPQFHAFAENNEWWGDGFTEWSNVAAAQPAFRGHNQPFLPADLGFYDLTSPPVRHAQYTLAKRAGIEGFMYYYYWFAGRRLMSSPIESHLDGREDEPFCIMWANENWSRRWDGRDDDILIAQDYETVPATQFIHDVMPMLLDPRYIRRQGRPILAVYRLSQIPDFTAVLDEWRKAAREAGAGELEILSVDVGEQFDGIGLDGAVSGVDGTLDFPPHRMHRGALDRTDLDFDERFAGNTYTYDSMVESAEADLREGVGAQHYPGVMVNYDNTARRQWMPELWYGANPYTFHRWLQTAVEAVQERPAEDRIVFVNAWNEWAEGAVLEPSQRFASTYLLAVRSVVGMPIAPG